MNKKRVKVLVFSLAYLPLVGGAEVALRHITKRITEIEFDLITARIKTDLATVEKQGNVNIYRVGAGKNLDKYLYPIRAFLLARKMQREKGYDVVWSMMATWAGIAAVWFKIAHYRVKYLLTLQSGDSDWFIWKRTWFWYYWYRKIYTKADHITVLSHWLEKRARKYGYKGDISLVPNGVEVDKIEQIKNQGKGSGSSEFKSIGGELKHKLNIPEKNKIVLTVSRLELKNDIGSLIKAVKILVKDYKMDVSAVIIGSGRERQKLDFLVKQAGLEANVIFLGKLSNGEALKYYLMADVFSRPSLSEGQGISFIEAMAFSVPVVATPVGGIPDFLVDKKTGLLCRVKNPSDLALKIKNLLEDKQLYLQIQNNALEMVTRRYNWDKIAQKMKAIIMDLAV